MKRSATLLVAMAMALCAWASDAHAGLLRATNTSGSTKVLRTVIARNANGTMTQTLMPDMALTAGQSIVLDFNLITMPHLGGTVWGPAPAPGPATGQDSIQDFQTSGMRTEWEYPVMFADQKIDIQYFMSDNALDNIDIPALGPGAIVTTNGAGQDISGRFPPTVIFTDADTMMPFQGTLVSEGIVFWDIPPQVPVVSPWALLILGGSLLAGGAIVLRRRTLLAV